MAIRNNDVRFLEGATVVRASGELGRIDSINSFEFFVFWLETEECLSYYIDANGLEFATPEDANVGD